ncbi:hypothetical protein L3081_24820 [Colwellia sp. MSW7]|jgi:hypothetical protein|uniref:Uncharacterized protein n=1 Tax=Colwellia maritima TaxID=2912588 RepID=A0ABS9X762_9GAMM|nr:hypothetical protein [Colwellia maritima]MCI2286049.1 hypothetical protein [Colwellia maritima]
MNSFKIKIPDTILCEYLKDLSPKARNFELVRLATNGLLMEKGVFNLNVSSVNSDINVSHSNIASNENSVTNEKKEDIKPVDFGMDITQM